MNIVFAASEGVPFSKTGGLADVVGALPRALAALGHQVSVYLPRYRQTKLTDPATVVRSVTVPFDDQYRFASVVSGGSQGGVRFYFVEYPAILRSRRSLRHASRGLSRQRRALRPVLPHRAGGVENSRRARHFSLPRLAVGSGSGSAAHHLRGRSRLSAMSARSSPSTTWATRACFRPTLFLCSCCPGISSPCRRWNSSARSISSKAR